MKKKKKKVRNKQEKNSDKDRTNGEERMDMEKKDHWVEELIRLKRPPDDYLTKKKVLKKKSPSQVNEVCVFTTYTSLG